MDYGGAGVYIKSSAMLLLSCLLASFHIIFPGDTAKTPTAIKPITTDNGDEIICFLCEPAPTFPGGEEALASYLKRNLKYPAAALKAKMTGTVFIQFVVDKTGLIREVRPLGPYKGYGMEAEAISVICNMPKWKPAKMDGKYTDVLFHIPIRFILAKQKP